MRKRRKIALAGLIVLGGLLVVGAFEAHDLLGGPVLAAVDAGPGYNYGISLAVDPQSGSAFMQREDGSYLRFSTRDGSVLQMVQRHDLRPSSAGFAVAHGAINRLYFAHGYDSIGNPGRWLDILDPHTNRLLYRRNVRNLSGFMAVDEPLGTLFVTTQTGISRLDARSGRLLGWTWSHGPNAIALDRRTQRVFVPVGGDVGYVSTIDARSGRDLADTRIAPNPYWIAVDEAAGRVYALSQDATVSMIGARSGKLLKQWSTPTRNGAGGFGVDTGLHRVVVCEGTSAHLLDGLTLRELARVDLGASIFAGGGSCGVGVDSARHVAYVSSGSGFKAIDTRTGAVLESLGALALRGGLVAVDTATHHVLVYGPRYDAGTAFSLLGSALNWLGALVFHHQSGTSAPLHWSVSILNGAR